MVVAIELSERAARSGRLRSTLASSAIRLCLLITVFAIKKWWLRATQPATTSAVVRSAASQRKIPPWVEVQLGQQAKQRQPPHTSITTTIIISRRISIIVMGPRLSLARWPPRLQRIRRPNCIISRLSRTWATVQTQVLE